MKRGRKAVTARRRRAGSGRRSIVRGEGVMDGLRDAIDAIDRRVVRLLNERAGHAIELGRVKKDLGMAIYQPSREEEVLRNVQEHNRGPLQNDAVRRLFERIIDESRRIERIITASEGATAEGGDRENANGYADSTD